MSVHHIMGGDYFGRDEVRDAARAILDYAIRRDGGLAPEDRHGWEVEAVHPYTGPTGEDQLFWVCRARLRNGGKVIRPMRWTGSRFEPKRPEFQTGAPLYNLRGITNAGRNPVFVVEGESCVDALAGLVTATTSGGAQSASGADWRPLAGREVVIWPDNDLPGSGYARDVAAKLRALNCKVRIIDAGALGLDKGGDAVDWLRAHPEATAADLLDLPMIESADEPEAGPDADPYAKPRKRKGGGDDGEASAAAKRAVELAQKRYDLFRDSTRTAYARHKQTGIVLRIGSGIFRAELCADYFQTHSDALSSSALRDAMAVLEGLAASTISEVNLRVAGANGDYWLDLGEPGMIRAVHLTPGCWEVTEQDCPLFLRSGAMEALPEPVSGGSLEPLWRVANIPAEDRPLVTAWLVDSMRPDCPYSVLELIGEQGTGKSVTTRALRRLIDPNAADLRAAPKSVDDAFVVACESHVFTAENISHLSAQIQDAMCVLATGGAHARRRLYTDADEVTIRVRRPVLINGISAAITAGDLADRALSIELPRLDDRAIVGDLWDDFERNRGRILGALLDVAANALEVLPDVSLPPGEKPRMLEFALLGIAVERVTGSAPGSFMAAYQRHISDIAERSVGSMPVGVALLAWLEANPPALHQRTAGQWLAELEPYRPPRSDFWPMTGKALSDAFRRLAPQMRRQSIDIRKGAHSKNGNQWIVDSRGTYQAPAEEPF